jgi:hypothetical protein
MSESSDVELGGKGLDYEPNEILLPSRTVYKNGIFVTAPETSEDAFIE